MNSIWIADFGSQYTQLITRRTRELGYRSEILTVEETLERLRAGIRPRALVLSGGPRSVYTDATDYSPCFADASLPVLGICYGMQLMGQFFGGTVQAGIKGEYGHMRVTSEVPELPLTFTAWMSHADHVSVLPPSFVSLMTSANGLIAGMKSEKRPLLGLQFHPEVEHTDGGRDILNYFFKTMARLSEDWHANDIVESARRVFDECRDQEVLCAFSGGVDSLVAAMVAHRECGARLHCYFVDHGLLRPQDYHHIETLKRETPLRIETIEAKALFFSKLKGVSDPEEKRKIIGRTFIEVFESKVKETGIRFQTLLQGTLYPDVIESTSPHKVGGQSVTIKSHHNVGGLPERMNLKLIEPLRFLFKDEVRALGTALGIPREWLFRHPFPGPGIGVRVLGEIHEESVRKVQESDQILFEEMKRHSLYDQIWQAFTVLIPQKTVGVKGDGRAYEEIIAIRLVNSTDGMTATWSEVPYAFLANVSTRITNEVRGVTRVVYDVTAKPPGTIEWE